MKTSNLIFDSSFNGYPVMSSDGSHSEILQRLHELLQGMCEKRCQVFVKTFVLQFPLDYQEQQDNSLFIKFLAELMRRLDYNGLDPSYLWCREACPEEPGRWHYHLVLLWNASICQRSSSVLDEALYYWAKTLAIPNANGLVYSCSPESELSFRHDGFKLLRSDSSFSDVFNEVFHYLSYLAKAASKAPQRGVRTFGSSSHSPRI